MSQLRGTRDRWRMCLSAMWTKKRERWRLFGCDLWCLILYRIALIESVNIKCLLESVTHVMFACTDLLFVKRSAKLSALSVRVSSVLFAQHFSRFKQNWCLQHGVTQNLVCWNSWRSKRTWKGLYSRILCEWFKHFEHWKLHWKALLVPLYLPWVAGSHALV